MAGEDLKFEQFVYTAGGTKVKGVSNANFGVLSTTSGLNDNDREEIRSIMQVVLRGEESSYKTDYRYVKVLKPGAVPKGLFNKKYRDQDYENVKHVVRNEIKVLGQTYNGDLVREQGHTPPDYRENPEKAPYRLATTTLQDGRVLVMRIGGVNRVYSERDTRNGNYFTHAFVFPRGTDLSRINVDKLPFRFGLTNNEWGKNGEPIDLSKIGKEEKKQTAETKIDKEDMELVDLLEVFRKSLPSNNKDVKSRMENKKIFNAEVKKGAKLFEVKNAVATMVVNDLKNGRNVSTVCEDVLDELEFIETPYSNLLLSLESYISNENKLSDAYENDDQELMDRLEEKSSNLMKSIEQSMKGANYEELLKVAQNQRQYLKLMAEKDALTKGQTLNSLNGSYMTKSDYKATNKLELMVKTRMNKNTQKR